MLKDLIASGFGQEEDYNCAEKMVYGANIAYHLKLDKDSLRMAAGFGGGMAIGDMCGAICGAVMMLSSLHVDTVAHDSEGLKPAISGFIEAYQKAMGETHCLPLKEKYRTPEEKCHSVIIKAAEILDEFYRGLCKEAKEREHL